MNGTCFTKIIITIGNLCRVFTPIILPLARLRDPIVYKILCMDTKQKQQQIDINDLPNLKLNNKSEQSDLNNYKDNNQSQNSEITNKTKGSFINQLKQIFSFKKSSFSDKNNQKENQKNYSGQNDSINNSEQQNINELSQNLDMTANANINSLNNTIDFSRRNSNQDDFANDEQDPYKNMPILQNIDLDNQIYQNPELYRQTFVNHKQFSQSQNFQGESNIISQKSEIKYEKKQKKNNNLDMTQDFTSKNSSVQSKGRSMSEYRGNFDLIKDPDLFLQIHDIQQAKIETMDQNLTIINLFMAHYKRVILFRMLAGIIMQQKDTKNQMSKQSYNIYSPTKKPLEQQQNTKIVIQDTESQQQQLQYKQQEQHQKNPENLQQKISEENISKISENTDTTYYTNNFDFQQYKKVFYHDDIFKEEVTYQISDDITKQIIRPESKMFLESDWYKTKNQYMTSFMPQVFYKIMSKEQNNILRSLDLSFNFQEVKNSAGSDGGKSGEFFLFSHDNNLVLKTITETELARIKKSIKEYYIYVQENETYISKIYGVYKFYNLDINPVIMILMDNLTKCPRQSIIRKYDMKGSTFDREVLAKIQDKNNINLEKMILKDIDFIKLEKLIKILPENAEKILHILKNDSLFLRSQGFIDYSFVLFKTKNIKNFINSEKEFNCFKSLGDENTFYRIGIIDYLEKYTLKKKIEKFFKRLIKFNFKLDTSSQNAIYYQERFINFMHIIFGQENKIVQQQNKNQKNTLKNQDIYYEQEMSNIQVALNPTQQ
ncbi:hypothetical protein PPERSA_02449 [Pseudocohnilembus persalinus]|uniref:PIPK domain-containing protein n=1 Tax=Pseudocohnilembus persalinus TaxID=266149 RepID=A0A0V0QAT4_PSEPJ|nr:hypothetical protein PPERSA_02449 [Pseudocohnilembus persalinus]|eukprot:KRW99337.1 hypothetical protein PPERSA_02449 [Pseudocohnilembus persalinus]